MCQDLHNIMLRLYRESMINFMIILIFCQVLTYGAFYDNDMEWVGLENIQLVFSLTTADTLSPRFISINNIYFVRFVSNHLNSY